jgi:hypothetical protein
MRKEKTLFLIGLWVMILPFLGFPNNWRRILFFITGLALIYLAYLLYLETKSRLAKMGRQDKNFIDNIEDKKNNQTPEIRI